MSRIWSNRSWAFSVMVVWMAVIFSFSMLSGKEIAGPTPMWYFIERKGAHVLEYAVLTIFAFNYFRLVFRRSQFSQVLTVAMAFAVTYGVTDELHQFFVPFRGARFSDVLIDGVGVVLAGLILFWWQRSTTKNRSQKGRSVA